MLSGFYHNKEYFCHYSLHGHLEFFLSTLKSFATHKSTNVLFLHVMRFDFASLLWDSIYNSKVQRAPDSIFFSLIKEKVTIEIHMGKVQFGKIIYHSENSHPVTVHIIDSFSFFKTSLKAALIMLKASVQKEERPEDFGLKIESWNRIKKYFRADLKGGFLLGEAIINFHKQNDVSLSVSVAHLSSKIFRHKYLKFDIKKLHKIDNWLSLRSYHGGKNGFYVEPGRYKCKELDIRSAYPEAMKQLPNFYHGKIKVVKEFTSIHGIYSIKGYVKDCKYSIIFTDNFKAIKGQRVENAHITGYELKEAIDSGELELESCNGIVWSHSDTTDSPFIKFVDDMYEKKEHSTNKVERYFYKTILSSLYGKFIQRVEIDSHKYRVGSMFFPFLASLITGFVRAKIHRLEHEYQSLHTATDSVMTMKDFTETSTEIGSLKLEVDGICDILRCKLYVHYDKQGIPVKWGLHGFQGTVDDLVKFITENDIYKIKKAQYIVKRLVGWKESFHTGLHPNQQIERKMELRI